MKFFWRYCFRVWITAVLVGPIVLLLMQCFLNTQLGFSTNVFWAALQLLSYILYMAFFGTLLSAPGLLIFYFTLKFSSKLISNQRLLKSFLSGVGILLAILPFLILFRSISFFSDKGFVGYLSYPLVVVAAIWYYDLSFKTTGATE